MPANPPPDDKPAPPRAAASPRSDTDHPQPTPGGSPGGIQLAAGNRPLPDYELVRQLGKGGYGEVWQATGPGGFDVALKFVRLGEAAGDVELRALELMKRIRHANLLHLSGAWQREGWLIVAMELAERTLLQRLREARAQGQQGIPAAELLEYMRDAARGLDYLNECRDPSGSAAAIGIQHKDVKPENLLLVGGTVKVADFGLAKLLEHTVTQATGLLTPAYAAPEFFRGQATRWSDQYSLAVSYCQLRGGQLPFRGDSHQVLAGHLMEPPDLAMVPEVERPAVARALSKRPEERWPSCRDFVKALQAAVSGPTAAGPAASAIPSPSSTASAPVGRTLSPGQAPLPRQGKGTEALSGVPAPWHGPSRAWTRSVMWIPLVLLLLAVTVIGGWFWLSGLSLHTGVKDSQARTQSTGWVDPVSHPWDQDPTQRRGLPPREQDDKGKDTPPGGEPIRPPVAPATNEDGKNKKAPRPEADAKKDPPVKDPPKTEVPPASAPIPPEPLDCTGPEGVSKEQVQRAQQAWAKHLGRQVEEKVEVAEGVTITFVLIPPGKFRMGSPDDEKDRYKDEALHAVTLTEPFYLAQTEVTQAQYQALTGENPSHFKGTDKPVEMVSWEEARDCAAKLTKKRDDKQVYRLPTEAEWEYSCRGGRSSSQPFGVGTGRALSSREANFDGNYPYGGAEKGEYLQSTCRVASYTANAFGLYDMHGNVWEWCADWYGPNPEQDVTNPTGPAEGSGRVFRGGSWFFNAGDCRAAHRNGNTPSYRYYALGLRLARSIPSGSK
jgi:formylglycine-generating enzyme required for sulfatase activity/serine/threonine protein kinase